MFTFSTTVYEVLWEALGLPPMPARIRVMQHGATQDERHRVRATALGEAEQLGLGRPPDLDSRLADLLDLLAHHARAVSLRELVGHRRRGYAAGRGHYGVLAVIQGDHVSLGAVSGDHLASELLTLLPPLSAGPGLAVSVPATAFETAMKAYAETRDSFAARDTLRTAGVGGKDIERLLTIGRDTVSFGSIGVHKREHAGMKLVGSIAYTDTPHGRYAIVQRHDHAGHPYTSIIPTDVNSLRRRLQELLATAETR